MQGRDVYTPEVNTFHPHTHEDIVLAFLSVLEPKVAFVLTRNITFIFKLAIYFLILVNEDELHRHREQWRDLLYAKENLKYLNKYLNQSSPFSVGAGG